MPHSAVSGLGLHLLPITHLGVYRLTWIKETEKNWCFILFLVLKKNLDTVNKCKEYIDFRILQNILMVDFSLTTCKLLI